MTEQLTCEQVTLLVASGDDSQAAAIAQHLATCTACAAEAAALRQLQQWLDRPLQPAPLARMRFMAALQAEPVAAGNDSVLAWWQSLWRQRPLGAFSYSAALLLAGVLGGQLLPPHSLGIGPELATQTIAPERLVQLCAVPPAPASSLL